MYNSVTVELVNFPYLILIFLAEFKGNFVISSLEYSCPQTWIQIQKISRHEIYRDRYWCRPIALVLTLQLVSRS